MTAQIIILVIEIFSNYLIILKKQNNLCRRLNWHEDCFS
jgi:hypothetical protein